MKKLEVHAATMVRVASRLSMKCAYHGRIMIQPETALTGDDTPNPLGAFTAATNGQTTLASSAAGAAGALAGWAISSIGKKVHDRSSFCLRPFVDRSPNARLRPGTCTVLSLPHPRYPLHDCRFPAALRLSFQRPQRRPRLLCRRSRRACA